MANCSSCGLELQSHWKECPRCETPVGSRCPSCGADVAADWRKCPECRTPLASNATSSPPAAAPTPAATAAAPMPQPPAAVPSTPPQAADDAGVVLGRGFGDEQFVRIPAGRFVMGSDLDADNMPHEVTLTRPFLLQKTLVTQAQWKEVMGTEPSQFQGDDLRPVEQVSFTDIQEFLRALEKATGQKHRLPTDAEWEYACRAGSTGNLAGDLSPVAWHKGNSGGTTQPVATKAPNEWGLYDMHGNVCEWVQDYYSQLTEPRAKDPTGAAYSTTRVVRGASWFNNTLVVRSTPRGSREESIRDNVNGFRIVRIG